MEKIWNRKARKLLLKFLTDFLIEDFVERHLILPFEIFVHGTANTESWRKVEAKREKRDTQKLLSHHKTTQSLKKISQAGVWWDHASVKCEFSQKSEQKQKDFGWKKYKNQRNVNRRKISFGQKNEFDGEPSFKLMTYLTSEISSK